MTCTVSTPRFSIIVVIIVNIHVYIIVLTVCEKYCIMKA